MEAGEPKATVDVSALTAGLLAGEAERLHTASASDDDPAALAGRLFAGADTTRSAVDLVRAAGIPLVGVLFALNLVDEFTPSAVNVLAPDIQRSLHIGDTVVGVTGVLSGGFLLLGSLPVAVLSDRMRRLSVISITSVLLGVGNAAGGRVVDRLFERDPERAVIVGAIAMGSYVLVVPALYAPNIFVLVAVLAVANAGIGAGFVAFTAICSAVLPYRLRSQGFALLGLYPLRFRSAPRGHHHRKHQRGS